MRVRFPVVLGCILLTTPALADDLSYLRAIRSLSAEAAEVIRLEKLGRVTPVYAAQMKAEAKQELSSAAEEAQSPILKRLAQSAGASIDRNDAGALSQIVQRLFAMEGPHEPAD